MGTQIGYSGILNGLSHSLGSRGGGAGGIEKVTADNNGSVFTTSQFGKQLRCHRFQGSGDNSLYINSGTGNYIWVWAWGAAGGNGGQGGAHGGSGGAAYARLILEQGWVQSRRFRAYVGGGGSNGGGCFGCWGGGGNGNNGSGYGSGGRGNHASCRGCSAGGGGG